MHNWQDHIIEGRREYQVCGYIAVQYPEHPYAMSNGLVYKHRLVKENELKRYLLPHETCHHKDGDRQNNLPHNIGVFGSHSEHVKHHQPGLASIACKFCGQTFQPTKLDSKYCSRRCSQIDRFDRTHAPWPSKEELQCWVSFVPATKIAAALGVSGRAVGKRCAKLGIRTPGRGYWRQVETGYLRP